VRLRTEAEQKLWGPRNRDAAWWHVATPLMFGRLSRMTPNGALRCRCRPSCYWETTWSGHSSQGQVSLVSLATAGWPAGAWDDPVHEQPPKGGLSPVTGYDPGTGVRDLAAFRPLSSCCQGSGTLDMSDPTLSVSVIVLSLSTGACWSPPSPCAGGWSGLVSSRSLPDGRRYRGRAAAVRRWRCTHLGDPTSQIACTAQKVDVWAK
jgi:hypothetical protein